MTGGNGFAIKFTSGGAFYREVDQQVRELLSDWGLVRRAYTAALHLAAAVGQTERANDLMALARRFLTLAGERALGLDSAHAEALFSRALQLTSDRDEVSRCGLLLALGEAQRGPATHPPRSSRSDRLLCLEKRWVPPNQRPPGSRIHRGRLQSSAGSHAPNPVEPRPPATGAPA